MTMQEFNDYLDDKIQQNENLIKITFYELRIKLNLSEEETNQVLEWTKNKFEKMNYKIYFTGEEYKYQNSIKQVQSNELMIAIKNV